MKIRNWLKKDEALLKNLDEIGIFSKKKLTELMRIINDKKKNSFRSKRLLKKRKTNCLV